MSLRLTYLAYALAWAVVRRLPEPVARKAFQMLADLTWWRRGRSVRRLEDNLRRVLGPDVSPERLRAVSREGMRSYLRYWCEAFRLPVTSPEQVRETFVLEGADRLWDAVTSGKGAVVVLPHMGNWDHAGAWAVLSGLPFTTVAERLRPERLFERFLAYRQGLGMEVIPLTGADRDVSATLTRRLRAGGLVCLVGDRDLTPSGVEVTFFGETARMPAGPAALALHTGAPLLPVTLWYEGGRQQGVVHPAVEPPAAGDRRARITTMTQQVAAAFETGIAAHPADWHMLQRLWSADLDPTRNPRA